VFRISYFVFFNRKGGFSVKNYILLAKDLDLIVKGESGPLKKDIAEIERILKALIKSLENKPLPL